MDWSEDAFVLSARRFGETSAIVELLTASHGRHAGLLRGGAGKRSRATIETGNLVHAHWRARLSDQLGTLTLEPLRAHAARLLDRPGPLAALAAAAALLSQMLPERDPHPAAFADFGALIAALEEAGAANAEAAADSEAIWGGLYVRWELALLAELGFGLDLRSCAVTGDRDDLAFVSPKSGHAVGRAAAGPYRERLLTLPAFLVSGDAATREDLAAGLELTGYFLDTRVAAPDERKLPAARARLISLLVQSGRP